MKIARAAELDGTRGRAVKCVKCGQQKGKRPCPALGGDICSACCGTHRLKEISCPADCQWLGGLAVAAGLKEPPSDEVRAAAADVSASIAAWLRTYRDRQWFVDVALDEVFGDDDPSDGVDEWLLEIWLGGLQHGVVDQKGRRVVEIMLAQRARDLAPAHAAVLRSLAKSWFSAFRVERVDLDAGMLLRDTIDDREIYVHEKKGTHGVKPLDVVLAFVATTGGVEMFHGIVRVPPAHVIHIIDELRGLLAETGTSDRVAATPHVWGPTLGRLRELVRDFRPQFQNTDGEVLFPSKARFEVVDEDALRRALATCTELDADQDGDGWGWRRGEGDGALSLGRLSLDGKSLILEVNSRERLERGKALVSSLAGAAVKHRIDEHMDMDRMIADARGRPAPPRSTGIPEDVEREIIGEALGRMYANVLDEPVPMLDHKTPRQAARASADGKRRVREWLDGLEHSLLSMPGASEAIDVDVWRLELGIEPRHRAEDEDEDDDEDEGDLADAGGEPDWLDTFDPEAVEALAERIDKDPRAWLDEPTSLLDGQQPRAAAKDPAMRQRVHLLVDGIEECSMLEPRDLDLLVKALGLDDTELVYHPATPPDCERWLRYHVREREVAVLRAHTPDALPKLHPKLEDKEQHVIEHQVIESWIARDAHGAPAALSRLLADGLNRHEAIHALGAAFARIIDFALDAEEEVDEDIAGELADVRPDPWRGTVG